MAVRVFRRLRDLLDVTVSSPADGDVLTYDSGTSKFRNEAASGGGGSLPDPLTTPLNIELASDAVALSVTAASGGSENLLELNTDNPESALAFDSLGRVRQGAVTIFATSGVSSINLPVGASLGVYNDDTGDPIVSVVPGTPNTLDLDGDVSVNGVPYSGNGFPVALADDEDVKVSSADVPTTSIRFSRTGAELALEGSLAGFQAWRLTSGGVFESWNAGPFLLHDPQVVPASPTVQDVVDALVALGLVTQAA